jgi:hypothetical protein
MKTRRPIRESSVFMSVRRRVFGLEQKGPRGLLITVARQSRVLTGFPQRLTEGTLATASGVFVNALLVNLR